MKKFCPECQKETTHIGGQCHNCGLLLARLEIQQLVKDEGIKSAQILWEEQKKQIKVYIDLLTSEEKKLVQQSIKQIDKDLYPNTIGIGNYRINIWWIVFSVILLISGIVGFIFWRKKKNTEKEQNENN